MVAGQEIRKKPSPNGAIIQPLGTSSCWMMVIFIYWKHLAASSTTVPAETGQNSRSKMQRGKEREGDGVRDNNSIGGKEECQVNDNFKMSSFLDDDDGNWKLMD